MFVVEADTFSPEKCEIGEREQTYFYKNERIDWENLGR